ncbi:MAG: hypothetical protein GX537_02755 [Actinobacteria bacterium]|nr:hypothetical protein [Actinomycetota bacterium]
MTLRFRGSVGMAGCLTALVAIGTGCQAMRPGPVRHPLELQDGKLVICRLQYGPEYQHEIRPQGAAHDYAILIDWPNDTCTSRLFVYDRPHGHVGEARSFDTFLELVDRLPRGVPVAWVNTCCAPISYGMGSANETRLRAVLARGGHTLLTAGDSLERASHYDDLLICTCESVRMYLPGDVIAGRGTGVKCSARSPE